jgi:WD40 repeat protein
MFKGHNHLVSAIAFSPDGMMMVTAGCDSTVRLWVVATGKEIRKPRGLQAAVSSLAVSPDGKCVATAGWQPHVLLWNADTGAERQRLAGHRQWVNAIGFCADAKNVASAGEDGLLIRWDVVSGKELSRQSGVWDGYHRAFSPDGNTLASAHTVSRQVRLRAVPTGKLTRWFWGALGPITFAGDGKTLAGADVGNEGWMVAVWDVSSGKELHRFSLETEAVWALALSPDGAILATGEEPFIRLFRVASGKQLSRLDCYSGKPKDDGAGDRRRKKNLLRLARRGYEVLCLVFSPDGRTVASGGRDAVVRLWEVASGKERVAFRGHSGAVQALAFFPDGRRLASGSKDTTALVWDLTSGGQLEKPAAHRQADSFPERQWKDLLSQDAEVGYRAMWTLAKSPKRSIPVLQKLLRPAPMPDAAEIARLLKNLDGPRFITRRKAIARLQKLGESAEPALVKALAKKPSTEARRQIEGLLDKLRSTPLSPEQLRTLRAVEALEYAGTPAARKLLESLAKGAPGVRLTREAQASLARLANRAAVQR